MPSGETAVSDSKEKKSNGNKDKDKGNDGNDNNGNANGNRASGRELLDNIVFGGTGANSAKIQSLVVRAPETSAVYKNLTATMAPEDTVSKR